MRLRRIVICFILSMLALTACKNRPSNVLSIDDLAEILADMHVGEAVVEGNHQEFNNDSARKDLKQSILARHGSNPEQFDTSLVWYAHNIDKYIEVYDKTIEILEARNANIGNMMTATAMSMAGDSVDLWGASKFVKITDLLPSRMVTFDIATDENSNPGDVYTWRMKMIEEDQPNIAWSIVANYDDNSVETLTSTSTSRDWNEVTFITDSTKQLTRLRGYFLPKTERVNHTIWIDSISLVRKRLNSSNYGSRYARQKTYKAY